MGHPAYKQAMANEESPSLVKLVGALFAAALVTALAVGAVVATRLDAPSFALSWLAASAAYALPALVVAALVRLAAAAIGGGASAPQFRPVLVALALTSATVFVFALALGRVLRQNTHHTGLAGTTFAVVCAVLALGVLPLGLRLAGAMRGWKRENQSLLVFGTVLAAGLMMAMAMVRVQRAVLGGELGFGAAVPSDVMALIGFGVLAALAQVGRLRAASLLGPPLFVGLVLLGVALAHAHPELAAALSERALLAARCSAWMVR